MYAENGAATDTDFGILFEPQPVVPLFTIKKDIKKLYSSTRF
jgi:hypothetical protein